jgi:hypothetical protein
MLLLGFSIIILYIYKKDRWGGGVRAFQSQRKKRLHTDMLS